MELPTQAQEAIDNYDSQLRGLRKKKTKAFDSGMETVKNATSLGIISGALGTYALEKAGFKEIPVIVLDPLLTVAGISAAIAGLEVTGRSKLGDFSIWRRYNKQHRKIKKKRARLQSWIDAPNEPLELKIDDRIRLDHFKKQLDRFDGFKF
jgi:hypothetical protein